MSTRTERPDLGPRAFLMDEPLPSEEQGLSREDESRNFDDDCSPTEPSG